MREEIYITEDLYSSQFSLRKMENHDITYTDISIPDMYDHNYTLVTDRTNLLNVIEKNIKLEDNQKKGFFMVYTYFPIEEDILKKYPNAQYERFDFMELRPEFYHLIKSNPDCNVIEANYTYYNKSIEFNIETNKEYGDFGLRSILSKLPIYRKQQVRYFICLKDNKVIGSCELFINKETAKIDDFSVLEEYQRNGYGSTILRKLIEFAYNEGVKIVYLITSSTETAKEMYKKCGFTKTGEKFSLFFNLNKV